MTGPASMFSRPRSHGFYLEIGRFIGQTGSHEIHSLSPVHAEGDGYPLVLRENMK
jgi:hypothetical protein